MIKHILWEGKSQLDGKPIVLIALQSSTNRKTGAMIQTYILRSDVAPLEASQTGADASICGDCPHKPTNNGTCYVRLDTAPTVVWKAYKRGRYSTLRKTPGVLAQLFAGQVVRLGTYGDPVAIPYQIWQQVLLYARGWTGYTHQWYTFLGSFYRSYCMASCDTPEQASEAQAKGWRTFTVVPSDCIESRAHELLCPASEQAGRKLTCSECLACGGTGSRHQASVYIPVHGVQYKQARFNTLIQIGAAG